MENRQRISKAELSFLSLLAILVWFALIAQFFLHMNNKVVTFTELLIRFFSYFTILTNLLVAMCCTFILLPEFRFHRFFSDPKSCTAVAVYISVVGLIYNIILRDIWKPEGLQMVVNEMLHSAIPILYLVYWFIFVPKNQLEWRNFFLWLIYPLGYVVIIVIRGLLSGFYPYPFMDIDKLGANAVIVNSFGITAVFVFFSLLFIAIGKYSKKIN